MEQIYIDPRVRAIAEALKYEKEAMEDATLTAAVLEALNNILLGRPNKGARE